MSPVSLYITDFEDERCRFDYYWPRLRNLDVPVPKTTFVSLEPDGDSFRWETDEILAFMERNGYDRAFVRTQVKAATVRLREGSFIYRPDEAVVDRTVTSLLNQNDQQSWPHGGGLVVREWVDFDFCPHPTHTCHPSVRFFIDDGEILGHTPTTAEKASRVCSDGYDYLESRVADVDLSVPRRYAEHVANELSEATWGVDFIMSTNGEWYCVECNFNGVYWNRKEKRWWNMCGQGEFEPWSPVELHSAALRGVKPSEDTRVRRWW
ncbi:ATP-grasp domain-containing protein [Haladaptatus cibarius]|uniref:ATP-grasp domain-containing protein n=1 Tax=Haladaptatus cibarius TaxID=453847 RepID=UPI000678ED48|nr:ATP-grasp domain-containing protein [Haladaptatus cibarius]